MNPAQTSTLNFVQHPWTSSAPMHSVDTSSMFKGVRGKPRLPVECLVYLVVVHPTLHRGQAMLKAKVIKIKLRLASQKLEIKRSSIVKVMAKPDKALAVVVLVTVL